MSDTAGAKNASIPERKDIDPKYTWDLSKLFPDEGAWEEGFRKFEGMIPGIGEFRGAPEFKYHTTELLPLTAATISSLPSPFTSPTTMS